MKPKLLIVDDDEEIQTQMKWALAKDYEILRAGDRASAVELSGTHRPAVALLDLGLPPSPGAPDEGLATLADLLAADSSIKVIIVSGQGEKDIALRAVGSGAYDFLCKPVEIDLLELVLKRCFYVALLEREFREVRQQFQGETFEGMLGTSARMQTVFESIRKVATTDAPVLVLGESGTGKEMVARAIHQRSARKAGPFVAINCSAIPETLLESELFGHEKGAFPGAQYRKKGKFEIADGGSVLLDEISDISLKTQTDLLRVLQEKEIVRVGGNQQIKVDFRCIAATNKNLEALVKEGAFRADLYYRLRVFCIDLPPLRERRDDIPLLVNHFLNKFCMATSRAMPQLSAEALEVLMRHDWPGNVRELENAVERALVVGRGSEIRPADFSFQFQAEEPKGGQTLDDVERSHIERILRETQHNLSRAARILDIDRTTLYNKLRRYGLR
jgi:two-component system NtrC family response regulator